MFGAGSMAKWIGGGERATSLEFLEQQIALQTAEGSV